MSFKILIGVCSRAQQLLKSPNKLDCINYSTINPVKNLKWRTMCTHSSSEERQKKLMSRGVPRCKEIAGVKDIILVVSGKGGVGKSTTSVNLAVALAGLPSKPQVGLLDADVFGPTVPLMMGVNEEPLLTEDKKMIPLINYNVKCMSMGFLVTEKSAVVWRGLMVMGALERLLRQVDWGSLDYLVVDTPPGTGDTLLSLLQNLPISGVVMVSTPQKVALQVTRRGATMLQKLKVPVIGIVQNMTSVVCPNCCYKVPLFKNEMENLTTELRVPLLADIPMDSEIANCGDNGKPIVILQPSSPQAQSYKKLSEEVHDFIQNKRVQINETLRT